jgi:hypothetical protein
VPIGSPTEPGREIGLGLFDPETRSPEVFDAVDRGRIVWRRPLSRIFTMPRPSTDAGWDVERIPNLGLFVGSVGSVPAGGIRAKTVDLAVSQTVGFSMRDGHVLWRAKGVYSCAQPFPCPGVSEVGYSSPENADEAGPTVGIALVERGTVSFTKAGSPPKVSNDASATIVGLDPRSGRVEWSFDAGRNVGLMSEDAVPPRVSETAIAIRSGTGRQVALDLRTGRTTPVRSGTKAWCQKAIEYRLAHSTYYSGKAGTYVGELSLFPCDTQGRAASPPAVVPSFVGRIGATLNGLTAWTEAAGVYARRS